MVDFRRRGLLGLFFKAPAIAGASEVAKALPEPPAAPAPPIPEPPPVVYRVQRPVFPSRSFIGASGIGFTGCHVTAYTGETLVPFRGFGGEEPPAEEDYGELDDDDKEDPPGEEDEEKP